MTKKKVKETFYELTRFYGMARKIGSYVVRDCLTEVFSAKCPTKISRDVESFVIVYENNKDKLEYRVRKNVANNTCAVTQTNYIGRDVLDEDKYIVHFPDDTDLFKEMVKADANKFYERI